MKNTLEAFCSRLDDTQEQISELDGRVVEIITTTKRNTKKWRQLEDLSDSIEHPNIIQIISIPEEEEKKKVWENIWRCIVENLPNVERK